MKAKYKFSNTLIEEANADTIEQALITLNKRAKNPIEQFGILAKPHILLSGFLTEEENQHISELCYSTKLRKVLTWINKNILLELNNDDWVTTSVKLRIATSQINKLEKTKVIDKNLNILLHDNLIVNIMEVQNSLLDELLPF